MYRRQFGAALLLSAGALLLAACDDNNSSPAAPNATALFDPAPASGAPVIPFPFDGLFGLFQGAATPTLAIPGVPAPLTDANQIDGFSTTASIYVDIGGQIDYGTVPANLLFINTATGKKLVYGTDFKVENENATAPNGSGQVLPISAQRSRLLISPLKPLAQSTTYAVVLTTGIKTLKGADVVASDAFNITSSATPVSQQTNPALAQYNAAEQAELEGLRSQLIYPLVQKISAATFIPASQFVLAWSFTTESIHDSLDAAVAAAPAFVHGSGDTLTIAPSGQTTALVGGLGLADLWAGTVAVPYYLQAADGSHDAAPLFDYWKADPAQPNPTAKLLGAVPCTAFAAGAVVNGVTLQPSASTTGCFPVPVRQSVQTIPVIVTVPHGVAPPAGGFPVVIFQHGVTRNREDALAVADSLAAAGFVVVAADLPLHGVAPTNALLGGGPDPFYRNQLFAGTGAAALMTGERTFDLDLENNATGAAGPDGIPDSSGTWFINLQSLISSRDNVREAVADLAALANSIKTNGIQVLGTGPLPVNPNRIGYFGHSLGAIVGSTFLAEDTDVQAAVLANPGGGVSKLLNASGTFGPVIAAGLAAAGGPQQGTDDYETFLRFSQTLSDAGDPINYAAGVHGGHAVDLIEVIDDTVVPNSALSTCPSTLNPATVTSTPNLLSDCPQVVIPGTAVVEQDYTIEPGYLSGTNPLYQAMGLTVDGPLTPPVNTPNVITGASLGYVVQFAQGTHGSVLDPTAFPAVTREMQSEAAQFLASGGQCLPIGVGASCVAGP
ncbi:MAG: hypothetical protein ISP90_13290 [Nevskia sp.]|nr:hypothetical protein [Nevskia sp.]